MFFRTPYIQTPNLTLPLLRGWCLLPILLIHTDLVLQQLYIHSCPGYINWTQLCYDILFETHLIVAMLYHVSPIRRYELLLQRLDRILILVVNAIGVIVCLHRVNALNILLSLILISCSIFSLISHIDSINLGINILIPLAGGMGLIRYLYRDDSISNDLIRNVIYNLAISSLSGVFYVLETKRFITLRSQFVGWHDFFHISISLAYLHRFINVRPHIFTHLC